MAQYVAVTTVSGVNGYTVVNVGDKGQSRDRVRNDALRAICGNQWNTPKDIMVDTMCKNLLIVPMWRAQREYAEQLEAYYDDMAEAFWQIQHPV